MTNLQSCAGGFVWVAVAAILMLATFEPVSVGTPGAESVQASAAAPANASTANA